MQAIRVPTVATGSSGEDAEQPVDLPVNANMNIETSKGAFACGMLVIALTIVLYIVFW